MHENTKKLTLTQKVIKNQTPVRGQDGKISDTQGKISGLLVFDSFSH
jgi:hypothetical protein